jgi:hypothetical protein
MNVKKLIIIFLICLFIIVGISVILYRSKLITTRPTLNKTSITQATTTSYLTDSVNKSVKWPKIIVFQEITSNNFSPRLNDFFDYSLFRGVFRNEQELKEIWKYVTDKIYDKNLKQFVQPILPVVDFSKYSVVWYADYGSKASVVEM